SNHHHTSTRNPASSLGREPRRAERQQVNNLHEHMDSCKSGTTKHATIVATTAFYRRVENGLHHTFTITIRQLFSA
ncbi:hypothetical protein SHY38_03070, partial [Bifidobacterium breve]|uniref:hypothetical protein n=1 Tax=Bifidobacterium breve TaxID=1685 RepID=UPI0029C4D500